MRCSYHPCCRYDKTSSRKARLLKVELQSVVERNNLLQASKFLKGHPSTAKMFIKRWLQPDELKEFKVIQKQCRELHDKSVPTKNGRKPYVIVSGKIMKRTVNGLLRPVHITSQQSNAQQSVYAVPSVSKSVHTVSTSSSVSVASIATTPNDIPLSFNSVISSSKNEVFGGHVTSTSN